MPPFVNAQSADHFRAGWWTCHGTWVKSFQFFLRHWARSGYNRPLRRLRRPSAYCRYIRRTAFCVRYYDTFWFGTTSQLRNAVLAHVISTFQLRPRMAGQVIAWIPAHILAYANSCSCTTSNLLHQRSFPQSTFFPSKTIAKGCLPTAHKPHILHLSWSRQACQYWHTGLVFAQVGKSRVPLRLGSYKPEQLSCRLYSPHNIWLVLTVSYHIIQDFQFLRTNY